MAKKEKPKENITINEPKRKSSNKGWIIFFLICAILLFLALLVILLPKSTTTGNVISNLAQNCVNVQVPYNETEYTTVSEPYTDNVCDNVNMIYKESYTPTTNQKDCIQQECVAYDQVCSQKNFWGNCVAYTNGACSNYNCIKYRISCGIKIENQEKQPLTYSINLDSYNYDTKQYSVIRVQNVYVAPLDAAVYTWDFTALPTDNLGCVYSANSAPSMQNCRDVIKVHDVQKTFIVTKYRTEQQCS